ncbi:hypothetical protein IFR04_000801 [Cadophora malorum]|uniref:Uncharacterized protein n=1 Tax=Cadophora malorum TaxID=108018 RepID=A0A8H7WJV2_9HELO|nr:hypothetical protein IFR04_000801 [Cadophora malorum]
MNCLDWSVPEIQSLDPVYIVLNSSTTQLNSQKRASKALLRFSDRSEERPEEEEAVPVKFDIKIEHCLGEWEEELVLRNS